ncbi:MAG TPA: hypothetical protein VGC32_15140 [Solirubrobacterales bacterium]
MVAIGCLVAGAARAAGAPITEFSHGVGTAPSSLTDGPDDNLWFVDAGAIGRITPGGQVTEFTSGLNPGSVPHAIISGPGGNLWFTDVGTTKALGEVTPGGAITEFDAGTHGLAPGAVPYDLTAGPDGSVWFTDIGMPRAIGEISATGNVTEFTYSNDVNDILNAITEGPDGNLYVNVQGNNPTVAVVDPGSGTLTKLPVTNIPANPDDITAGPDGNVWFDSPNSIVSRLVPATDAITEFGPAEGMQPGAAPDAITAGPDGNVWFIDQNGGDDAVGRVTSAGQITEFPVTGTPWDLTTGIDGDLWVPMSMPTAIDRVAPDGSVTQISAGFDPGADLSETNIVVGPEGNLWTIDDGTPKAIVRADVMLAPVAVTGAASGIGMSSATIVGTVNPRGDAATASVEYGTTPGLGSTVAAGQLPAADGAAVVSAPLTGLPPGARIYYRVRASNSYGTSAGALESFTTGPAATGATPTGGAGRSRTVRRSLRIGNRRIEIVVRVGAGACLARSARLSVSLRATTGRASARSAPVRIDDVRLYLDHGLAHLRKLPRGSHPRTVRRYSPDATVRRLPAERRLSVARLARGPHTLRITIDATRTSGRVTRERFSRTATVRFPVC